MDVTYALAALALACIGCAIYFGRAAFKANATAANATDRMYSQGKLADEAIAALVVDRDSWKQKADVATAQLAAAKVRLSSAEQQRNAAFKDERAHVAEELRTTDSAVAARVGNLVLSRPLPLMPQAGDTRSGDGDRGAAGVQPARPAKPTP